jgi:hypothetical protein
VQAGARIERHAAQPIRQALSSSRNFNRILTDSWSNAGTQQLLRLMLGQRLSKD